VPTSGARSDKGAVGDGGAALIGGLVVAANFLL
jgi:hypothetical protein